VSRFQGSGALAALPTEPSHPSIENLRMFGVMEKQKGARHRARTKRRPANDAIAGFVKGLCQAVGLEVGQRILDLFR
jgi:hypothetical protein